MIVDTSTVDPATSQENAGAAAEKGVGYLDCPILGRPSGCGNWTLPARRRAGTPEESDARARSVRFEGCPCGPIRARQHAEALNQLMFGAINSVTAEMFAAAVTVGMDPGSAV